MRVCDTLLHAGIVATFNSSGDILEDSSIAISGGRICAIGKRDAITREWKGRDEVELENSLLMPGLRNAHAHASMTFLRGVADDRPLLQWLEDSVFPVEARLTPEICGLGALLGYAEMIATGITACVDMYIFEDAVFEAAEKAGLRCLGGEAVFAFPSAACADYRQALKRTEELAERWKGHERISVAVNPHSVYTTTPEVLCECRKLAQKLDAPMHIHLSETAQETQLCLNMHGLRPVEYCHSLGLFETGMIAAHVVDVNAGEMELLAARGVTVAHCPSSNLKLASGLAPVPKMLEMGIKVALGTDGPASNNQLNLFMEMRLAALAHKLGQMDPTAARAGQVLEMALRECPGMPALVAPGALAEGLPADCIALDLRSPNFLPLANPSSQLVYSATGHECRMTMVGGEILYKDGEYTRFNMDDLRQEAKKLAAFAVARA